jgi:diaminopimelate epimerase
MDSGRTMRHIRPMAAAAFWKMHGLGNDFAVFDARGGTLAMTGALARRLADRHTGIGCDQLIVIEPPRNGGDAFMRIWNADGGEVAACGNATRCVAALLGGRARIETLAGELSVHPSAAGFTVDLGPPRFGWEDVPLAYPLDTADLPVGWDMLERPVALSVGNPHAVFFVEDADAVPLAELGPRIETDPLFPEGANVGVCAPVSRERLRLRVWERGAGLTRACGTGAAAAAVAAARRGLAERRVSVEQPGGALRIEWRDDGHVLMTGPAVIAFRGEVDLAAHGG